jgi:hypothetical protein
MISPGHKFGRSRGGRLKSENESTLIHLTRKKPIFFPKSVQFVRGVAPQSQQAHLDDNIWVNLSAPLSQILSHDHRVINDAHGQHQVPSPPDTSVEAFLFEFERCTVDLNNPIECEAIRGFASSVGYIFSSHVCRNLLYESELHFADIIKANPLKNSPAMFLLRFLYFLPTLMKNEPTKTATANNFQQKLQLLIEFATDRRDFYFVWSVPPATRTNLPPRPDTPKVIHLLNKTG